MMRKNETAELQIFGLNNQGLGTAKYRDRMIPIPGTVPGDIVRVKISMQGNRHIKADLINIIKPSNKRIKSRCASFDRGCGGCRWLNMEYGEQLLWKNKTLRGLIKNYVNNSVQPDEIIGMEKPEKYRNKMSLINNNGRLVFIQENSGKSIFLDNCPMEISGISKVYDKLKNWNFPPDILQMHFRGTEDGSVGVCFFVKRMNPEVKKTGTKMMKEIKSVTGIGVSSYRDYHTIEGRDYLEQKINELIFHIPVNGFFQTNYTQAGILQNMVKESAGEDAGNVLDLYCGSGFFTLLTASAAKKVTGIENNIEAIKNAVINAKINKIENTEFIAADVKKTLKEIKKGFFRTFIMDPPRSGCGIDVIEEILRLKPEKIIYISCSPETLAGELRLLTEKAYKIKSFKPVDMFPHTVHIETMVELESK